VQPADRQVPVPVVDEVPAPIERKLTAPVEPRVAAAAKPGRAAPVEEPEAEVQHIFIDGTLVPAPLASDLSPTPGMTPGSDRVSRSPVVVGALLSLILVLLYLVAR